MPDPAARWPATRTTTPLARRRLPRTRLHSAYLAERHQPPFCDRCAHHPHASYRISTIKRNRIEEPFRLDTLGAHYETKPIQWDGAAESGSLRPHDTRMTRASGIGKLPAAATADAKLMSYPNEGSGDVRRLKGIPGCRLRIGDWRVIFIKDPRSITVVAIGHRREIYD